MICRLSRTLLVLGVALLTGACVTSQEWAVWSRHPAHFASGDHAFFSMRNQDHSRARVAQADLDGARREGWWGQPVTVSSEQIVER